MDIMKENRTVAQDTAKGIMIIIVVLFHCFMATFEVAMDALSSFNIMIAITPFLLSSFFFYAGYNYVDRGKSFKENVKRRAKQLLLPIVVTYIVAIVLLSSIELIYDHSNVGQMFTAIGNSIVYSLMSEPTALLVGYPSSGLTLFSVILNLGLLWFLYCLFVCSIFFYLLVKFTNKRLVNLFSVVIALLIGSFCLGEFVGVYLPYTIQCYPVVLAIMLTAAYLRQKNFLNRPIASKKQSVYLCLNALIAEGIIVGVCVVCHHHFGAIYTGAMPGGLFDNSLRGFDAIIGFSFSILGTYFIHTVCRLLCKVPVVGVSLSYLGSHSAVFYLFHPIPIVFADAFFFNKQTFSMYGQSFIYLGFTFVVLTGVCFLLDFLRRKKQNPQDNVKTTFNA